MIHDLKRTLLEQKERDQDQMRQVQQEQHRILQETEAQHQLHLAEIESRVTATAQKAAEETALARVAMLTTDGSPDSLTAAEQISQTNLMRLEIDQMKFQAAGDMLELNHRVDGFKKAVEKVVSDTQELAIEFGKFRREATEQAARLEENQSIMNSTLKTILDQLAALNSQTVTAQDTATSAGTHATQTAHATAELLRATIAEREKAHADEIRELEKRIRLQERKQDLEKETTMAPELPAEEGGHRPKLSATRTHIVDKSKAAPSKA